MTNFAKPSSRSAVRAARARGPLPQPHPTRTVIGRIEDEKMAGRSTATLLITASTTDEVERLARRVHIASARAAAPFVLVRTAALPVEPWALREKCSAMLGDAIGGSLLMTDVEEMPLVVQEVILELLAGFQGTPGGTAAPVRLIAGTTVPLLDRVAAGAFSERLFYRLNVIHLVIGAKAASSPIRQ